MRTITIFRALVGAGHLDEANRLWREFGESLLVSIGAYSTTVELLGPLATRGSVSLRSYLTSAYGFLGQLDLAVDFEAKILAEVLEDEDTAEIEVSLSRLKTFYSISGAFIATDRCLDLREVLIAFDDETDRNGSVVLGRAIQAATRGLAEQAYGLLDQAERLGPPSNNPWFEDDIQFLRLYLALHADASLTQDQLSAALATARSWDFRRDVASLRCSLHTRDRQYEQALAASEEYEVLGRDAGLDVPPARTAFLLARLGRTAEATAAVEDALTRLPRLHPFQRPHYHLARALRELGRHAEGVAHARQAYRRAWAEGPPNYLHWDLQDARELLQEVGEPEPGLPVVDPVSVRIPLEDEIRAFITSLEAERRDSGDTGP